MIYMDSMFTATLFAIMWGFSAGLGQMAFLYIAPTYYGTACVGTLNSIFSTAMVLGSAIGPIAYGVSIDKVGSWPLILWWTVPLAVISTILLMTHGMKPVHRGVYATE